MDSLNLQSTEDQINGLGQNAVEQQNFIANYNAGQVENYNTLLKQQEGLTTGKDKSTMEEFGAYQVHLGDTGKALYDAVKAEGGSAVLAKTGRTLLKTALAPTKPFEGIYNAGKYAVNLPGKLASKVPVNGVNMGRQDITPIQDAERGDTEVNFATDVYGGAGTVGAQTDETMVDFYSRTTGVTTDVPDSVAGLYSTPTPTQTTDGNTIATSQPAENPVEEPTTTTTAENPAVETNAGTTTETGVSTGTDVAGGVDTAGETTEGVLETTRAGKLASTLKGGLSTAGVVAEGTAKVAGTLASGVFLTMDVGQQISSGKFFYGDDTAQNVGNTMNEIGSAMDVIGVASADPLLVALGVGASAVGGIISGVDELFEHKKQAKDGDVPGVDKPKTIDAQVADPDVAGAGGLAQASSSTLR